MEAEVRHPLNGGVRGHQYSHITGEETEAPIS